MGTLTTWTYPLYGIIYLLTAPSLWKLVARFLVTVLAASCVSIILWFHLFYPWHARLLSHLFGTGWFNKMVTTLVVLAEAAAPCYFIFDHRFKRLQHKLFHATLEMCGTRVTPLPPEDQARITALAMQRYGAAAAAVAAPPAAAGHANSTAIHHQQQQQQQPGGVGGMDLVGLVLPFLIPSPVNESKPMSLARNLVTLPIKLGAPFLLPLFAYYEGYADATQMLSEYWEAKGLTSFAAQRLMADALSMEYRSFGFVSTSLGYIPAANWLLGLSNAVGAAMWAAQLEKKGAAAKVARKGR